MAKKQLSNTPSLSTVAVTRADVVGINKDGDIANETGEDREEIASKVCLTAPAALSKAKK